MLHEIDEHIAAHPIHQESKFEHLLRGVLPILQFAVPLLFFKPEWQKYLRAFIAAANEFVPAVQTLDDEGDGSISDPNHPPPPHP